MKINSIPPTADALRLRAFPVDALKTIGVAGTISNNASDANNDIDFTDISCFGSLGGSISTSGTFTKRLDAAWAAGTGNGGLFSGTKANSTTYHCHAIIKDSDGSIDYGFDTSVTAANRPSGYTEYRRVWSICTDGSGNIKAFHQIRNTCVWVTAVADYSSTSPGTSYALQALTVPSGIPFEVIARLSVSASATGQSFTIAFGDGDDYAAAFSNTVVSTVVLHTPVRVWTNNASQVRIKASTASNWTGNGCRITTGGYIDDRRV